MYIYLHKFSIFLWARNGNRLTINAANVFSLIVLCQAMTGPCANAILCEEMIRDVVNNDIFFILIRLIVYNSNLSAQINNIPPSERKLIVNFIV